MRRAALLLLAALMSCASEDEKRIEGVLDDLAKGSAETKLNAIRRLRLPSDLRNERVTARLHELIGDSDETIRTRAAVAYAQIGRSVGETLTLDLEEADGDRLHGTLVALLAMKRPPDSAAAFVVEAIGSRRLLTRRIAIVLSAELGEPCVRYLLSALEDSNAERRRGAAQALDMIAAVDPEASIDGAGALLNAVQDADARARLHAVRAVGALRGIDQAEEALLTALNDEDAFVQEAAAYALGRLEKPSPDLEKTALKYLAEENAERGVRVALLYSLWRLGPSDEAAAKLDALKLNQNRNGLTRLFFERAAKRAVQAKPDAYGTARWEASDYLACFSSPRAADFNGDGVLDLVVGRGAERLSGEFVLHGAFRAANLYSSVGYLSAYDGRNGAELWHADASGELFGAPLLTDLNKDGAVDVLMGGRNGALIAVDGADGKRLWEFTGEKRGSYLNYYTAQLMSEKFGGGAPAVLVAHGGDPSRPPFAPRPSGSLLQLKGTDGGVHASAEPPDRAEIYMGVYEANGRILYGTGGETQAGSLWSASIPSFLRGDLSGSVRLLKPITFKGMVAPPALADQKIAVASFDGRLSLIHLETGNLIWEHTVSAAETWGTPAFGRFNADATPDLFACFSIGRWPHYAGSTYLAVDGASGRVLWKEERAEPFFSSPLTVDMDGDGMDEALILIADTARGRSQLYRFNADGGPLEPVGEPLLGRAVGTPLIADLDGDGSLEIAMTAFTGPMDGAVSTLYVKGLDVPSTNHVGWGGYLGTRGNGVYQP